MSDDLIERLRAGAAGWGAYDVCAEAAERLTAILSERDAALAEAARLREALAPFAALAEHFDAVEETDDTGVHAFHAFGRSYVLRVGDFRRARAALADTQETPDA